MQLFHSDAGLVRRLPPASVERSAASTFRCSLRRRRTAVVGEAARDAETSSPRTVRSKPRAPGHAYRVASKKSNPPSANYMQKLTNFHNL